jgi:GNAT superfamily N-acetyltransferase
MSLRVVAVTAERPDLVENWRAIHNEIIPTSPLSEHDLVDRLARHRLTVAYDGDVLVANATVRPSGPDSSIATVIVRVLPAYRRRGIGSAYLEQVLADARALDAERIETVVLASNEDGLAFARAHGFVEHDRYTIEGQTIPFVDLHLTGGKVEGE